MCACAGLKGEYNMSDYQTLTHGFPPVYDDNSRILILGSFPSVKSREVQFYYGHPRNRFWNVLAAVLNKDVPASVPGRKAFLLENHIALWDVIEKCDIIGSGDSSIKNVIPTDLSIILDAAPVRGIFCNGAAAYKFFNKYQAGKTGREAVRLPSTSPANAAWSPEDLAAEWRDKLLF